jgi:hypothetical protein
MPGLLPPLSGPRAVGTAAAGASTGPVVGTVNLTMPLSSFLGAPGEPGEVAGFGPVAAADGRALADRLVGGGDAAGRGWALTVTVRPAAVRDCLHERESAGYQPPPTLRHVIRVRQRTCSFPGCRRPAARCDQDHTVPYDQGGRTCECNLAPAYRA